MSKIEKCMSHNELIRSVEGARNHLVDLEDLSDQELASLQKEFQRLREGSGDEEVVKNENEKVALEAKTN